MQSGDLVSLYRKVLIGARTAETFDRASSHASHSSVLTPHPLAFRFDVVVYVQPVGLWQIELGQAEL